MFTLGSTEVENNAAFCLKEIKIKLLLKGHWAHTALIGNPSSQSVEMASGREHLKCLPSLRPQATSRYDSSQ